MRTFQFFGVCWHLFKIRFPSSSVTCANIQLERLSQDTLALNWIKYLRTDHLPEFPNHSQSVTRSYWHLIYHNDHLHAGGARGVPGGEAHQHRREGVLWHDQPPRHADWERAGERHHGVQIIWVWSEGRHYTPVRELSVNVLSHEINIGVIEDLSKALTMLGLNPTEQETVDIPNQIARQGFSCSYIFIHLYLYFEFYCQKWVDLFSGFLSIMSWKV